MSPVYATAGSRIECRMLTRNLAGAVVVVALGAAACLPSRHEIIRDKARVALSCDREKVVVKAIDGNGWPVIQMYAACGCNATVHYSYYKGDGPMGGVSKEAGEKECAR